MTKWTLRVSTALLLCLSACDDADDDTTATPDAGPPASGGANAGGSGGTFTVPPREVTCGVRTCVGVAACCTAELDCGLLAPKSVFGAECVAAKTRGGTRSTTCTRSPDYCQSSRCQSFDGCWLANAGAPSNADAPSTSGSAGAGGTNGGGTHAGGASGASDGCGYWVDGWSIFGGEETLEITAPLGCVPRQEFVAP